MSGVPAQGADDALFACDEEEGVVQDDDRYTTGLSGQAVSPQGLLFEQSRPFDDLRGMLLSDFAGRKLSFDQFFDEHHVNKTFVEANYRDVLGSLESDDKIAVDRPKGSRRTHKGKPAFGKKVTITFPRKDE